MARKARTPKSGGAPSFVADENGVMSTDGMRHLVIPTAIFHSLRTASIGVIGRGYYGIAYRAGEGTAAYGTAAIVSALGGSADPRAIVDMMVLWGVGRGWGRSEIVELGIPSRRAVIRTYNCPFDDPQDTRREASCPLSAGFWAGVVEGLSGRPARAEETACISKGDPYCEFTVGPTAEATPPVAEG